MSAMNLVVRPSAAAILLSVFTAPSICAQVLPGEYLATVVNSAKIGEMYRVDTFSRKVTQLKMSAAIDPNCVVMQSPATGFVGTSIDPPRIYRLIVRGTTATLSLLFRNRAALGGMSNIAQMAIVGRDLWFTVEQGGLYSVPITGGDPIRATDLSKHPAWRVGARANALATDQKKIYVAAWNVGEVFAYDIASKRTDHLLTLPRTKSGNGNSPFYPVSMFVRNREIHVGGLFGDLFVLDTVNRKVEHYYAKTATEPGRSVYKEAYVWNADQGHYGLGTRDGALDNFVPVGTGHVGRLEVDRITSLGTRLGNHVTGLYYSPVLMGSYKPYAAGCAGSNEILPTSVGRGVVAKGSKNFAFGLNSAPKGSNVAVLMIGVSPVSIGLNGIGLPKCNLATLPILSVPVTTSVGTVDGTAAATIPFMLPNMALRVRTQWLVFHVASQASDAVSDARTLVLN